MRQVKTHNAIVRGQQTSVDGKVGGRARQRLHVDTPLRGIQTESLESALLAQTFVLINKFIASIVSNILYYYRY
jgi:hypothetical protein